MSERIYHVYPKFGQAHMTHAAIPCWCDPRWEPVECSGDCDEVECAGLAGYVVVHEPDC